MGMGRYIVKAFFGLENAHPQFLRFPCYAAFLFGGQDGCFNAFRCLSLNEREKANQSGSARSSAEPPFRSHGQCEDRRWNGRVKWATCRPGHLFSKPNSMAPARDRSGTQAEVGRQERAGHRPALPSL